MKKPVAGKPPRMNETPPERLLKARTLAKAQQEISTAPGERVTSERKKMTDDSEGGGGEI